MMLQRLRRQQQCLRGGRVERGVNPFVRPADGIPISNDQSRGG